MQDAIKFVIQEAQGFTHRADQYEVLKSVELGSDSILIQTVIHKLTREKFILKKFSKTTASE